MTDRFDVPSQHLVLDVDDHLAASGKMGVRRRRLFELGEPSRSALLIQHLLLLQTLHLQPRLVPLIIDAREDKDVQDQQTAPDRDRHAQGCRVGGVSVGKFRNFL